jgi:hypothetical protein
LAALPSRCEQIGFITDLQIFSNKESAMDVVDRLIAYRDRPGRSQLGCELLDEAAAEIGFLRREIERLYLQLRVEEQRDEPSESEIERSQRRLARLLGEDQT